MRRALTSAWLFDLRELRDLPLGLRPKGRRRRCTRRATLHPLQQCPLRRPHDDDGAHPRHPEPLAQGFANGPCAMRRRGHLVAPRHP